MRNHRRRDRSLFRQGLAIQGRRVAPYVDSEEFEGEEEEKEAPACSAAAESIACNYHEILPGHLHKGCPGFRSAANLAVTYLGNVAVLRNLG